MTLKTVRLTHKQINLLRLAIVARRGEEYSEIDEALADAGRTGLYTSGKNIDPKPWVNPGSGGRYRARMYGDFEHDPRPEFVRPNGNPILIAFRTHGANLFGGIDGWLKYAMSGTYADNLPIISGHIDHARKVLTRLAALETITEGQEN